jgi:hypothetical protein
MNPERARQLEHARQVRARINGTAPRVVAPVPYTPDPERLPILERARPHRVEVPVIGPMQGPRRPPSPNQILCMSTPGPRVARAVAERPAPVLALPASTPAIVPVPPPIPTITPAAIITGKREGAWTREEKDEFTRLWLSGMQIKHISPLNGRTLRSMRAMRISLNLPIRGAPKKPAKDNPWTDEQRAAFAQMWNDGAEASVCAARLGKTVWQVRNQRFAMRLPTRRTGGSMHTVISFVQKQESEAIKHAARRYGQSVSAYVRRVLVEHVAKLENE